MSCKNIIIFYEKHDDKHPIKTIKDLSSLLKNIGIKSYCFEEPSNESKEELLGIYESQLNRLKSQTKVSSFQDNYIKSLIASGVLQLQDDNGDFKEVTPQSILSNEEKKAILHYAKELATSMVESLEETVSLIHQTDEVNLNFCSMDMPRTSRFELNSQGIDALRQLRIRNEYMKNEILEQCKKGDVLALVGAARFGLADLLRDEKLNVKEYYVTNRPMQMVTESEIGDFCLRSTDHDKYLICGAVNFNGLVIDLYNDPDLDPVQLIANDLTMLNAAHDEL